MIILPIYDQNLDLVGRCVASIGRCWQTKKYQQTRGNKSKREHLDHIKHLKTPEQFRADTTAR